MFIRLVIVTLKLGFVAEKIASQNIAISYTIFCNSCYLVAKSCLNLCDSVDCSQPGSSIQRIPRHEYWSGLPFPSPGNLPDDPGIEFATPALQADSFTAESSSNITKWGKSC